MKQTTQETRVCTLCKEIKSLDLFSSSQGERKNKRISSRCKECRKKEERRRLDKKKPQRIQRRKDKEEKLLLFEQSLKRCKDCSNVKSFSEFYNDKGNADGKTSRCRDCYKVYNVRHHLKHGYDLSSEKYKELLKIQGEACAVCGKAAKDRKLNIDHCHKTHLIRGLLCNRCNGYLLPIIEDRPEIIERVFEYLKNPPAFAVLGKQKVSKNPSRKVGKNETSRSG